MPILVILITTLAIATYSERNLCAINMRLPAKK